MLREADGLLRSTGRYAIDLARVPWGHLAALLVAGGVLYGAAMGLFGGRPLQSVFSASKVPMLFVVTTLVCLPSFFVVNTLLGLREDFSAALRGVVAAQATGAVCLAALGPLTLVFYGASADYDQAIVFNGMMFLLGTVAGQVTLARHYRPLLARNRRHRIGQVSWVVLYVFVAIQLAWVLRPFVGSPHMVTRYFREEAWSNAYVVVLGRIWEVLTGS
jgi:hypothetical protein